jgi:hypothetical protein
MDSKIKKYTIPAEVTVEERDGGMALAYIKLGELPTSFSCVGTLPVKGTVNYRKHHEKNFDTDTSILLDFDGDGRLCGIEILNKKMIPLPKE